MATSTIIMRSQSYPAPVHLLF